MCGCLLTYDGGNCCVTYQIVMIQNNLISDYLFELSLWQGMLETLMTVRKHVVGIQIGRHRSVRLYVVSLTHNEKTFSARVSGFVAHDSALR